MATQLPLNFHFKGTDYNSKREEGGGRREAGFTLRVRLLGVLSWGYTGSSQESRIMNKTVQALPSSYQAERALRTQNSKT